MPPFIVNGVQARPLVDPRSGVFSGAWASAAPLQAARATPARIPTHRVVRASDPSIDFNVKKENICFCSPSAGRSGRPHLQGNAGGNCPNLSPLDHDFREATPAF